MINTIKNAKMNNLTSENAVTFVAVHTHTHTGNLLEKINRRNINKACKLSILY